MNFGCSTVNFFFFLRSELESIGKCNTNISRFVKKEGYIFSE